MVNYVKFLKGTPSAYTALEPKDSNTLYFITAPNATVGKLYLGDILVAGSVDSDGSDIVDSLSELIDVNLAGLKTGQVLSYNGSEWVPVSLPEAVNASTMIGATKDTAGAAGLVPKPEAGDHNKFLRGDGTWAELVNGEIDVSQFVGQEDLDAIEDKIETLEEGQNDLQETMSWGTL